MNDLINRKENEFNFEEILNDREILKFVYKYFKDAKGFSYTEVERSMKAYSKHIGKKHVNEQAMYRLRAGTNTKIRREHWADIIDGSQWWLANKEKISGIDYIPPNISTTLKDLSKYIETRVEAPAIASEPQTNYGSSELILLKKDVESLGKVVESMRSEIDMLKMLLKKTLEDNTETMRHVLLNTKEISRHASVLKAEGNRGD